MDRLVGLDGVRCDIAMMRTPDGHGGVELMKFRGPTADSAEPCPPNRLGIRRIMLAVEGIDDVVARLRARGAELVGELVQYENSCRLRCVRGPEHPRRARREVQLTHRRGGRRVSRQSASSAAR